jgi:hypothetical protein
MALSAERFGVRQLAAVLTQASLLAAHPNHPSLLRVHCSMAAGAVKLEQARSRKAAASCCTPERPRRLRLDTEVG